MGKIWEYKATNSGSMTRGRVSLRPEESGSMKQGRAGV